MTPQELEGLTVAQLKDLASENGITVVASSKKADLVETLRLALADDVPPEAPSDEAPAEGEGQDDGQDEPADEPADADEAADAEPEEAPAIAEDDVDEDTAFPGVTLDHEVGVEEMADGTECHIVDRDDLFLAVRSVRDQGYRILSCLSASDDKKGPMQVFYSFIKPANTPAEFGERRIKVIVPKSDDDGNEVATTCPSITDVYTGAGWHEREMYDMYGIRFDGHPDLRRMFLPEGWTGFPMRKDYSEPEQFVAMQDGEDIVLDEQEEGSW